MCAKQEVQRNVSMKMRHIPISQFLEKKLRLKVNFNKSAASQPWVKKHPPPTEMARMQLDLPFG